MPAGSPAPPPPPPPTPPASSPLPPVDSLGEEITAWVALVDQLEAAQESTSAHDPTAERSITPLVDAMEAGLHALQPDERVWAREYLWLRDHPNEPLPPAAERAWWRACPCRLCRLDRRRAAFERTTAGMSDEARRQLLRLAAPQLGPVLPLSA